MAVCGQPLDAKIHMPDRPARIIGAQRLVPRHPPSPLVLVVYCFQSRAEEPWQDGNQIRISRRARDRRDQTLE